MDADERIGAGRRVLYIDDDPGLARLVQKHLTRHGFGVELAHDGPEGLQKAASGAYDAIVLDHYMPGQSGLETLAALRGGRPADHSNAPIVYVTGSEDLRIAVAALKAGAVDYVIKDVQGEFFALLRRALETALEKAELRRARAAAEEELRRLNETLEQRVAVEVAERRKMEVALHQAQKMEAVGQLTGGVAHDFNNLLTTILGSLELALPKVQDAAACDLIGAAIRAGERGARLVAHLLAFSRKQTLRVHRLDLNRLVDSATDDVFGRAIDPTIRIEKLLAPNLWPALADATQLELMLLNLAINARDAMPAGGALTISTRNVPADEAGRPDELIATGDCVAVIVSDTGTGMSEEIRAKAFEPFFTTKEVGKGSGLGLSMVYGVARQIGGTVRLESELGRGTSVTIYLPRACSDFGRQETAATATGGAAHGGTASRVLLVDDDEPVLALTAMMLREHGYSVLEANGGAAALGLLDRCDEPIDVLVTDLAMPGMRGSELAAYARRRRPDLPVLLERDDLRFGHGRR
jgi:signal transduction histidine kinase